MLEMQTRLHARIAAALVASALLLASGAQGLRYARCATGEISLHRCCPPQGERPAQDTTLQAQQAGCCETLVVPSPEPQEPQVVAPASLPAIAAQAPAIVTRYPRWTMARIDPREASPPEGTSLELLCSLLI